MNNPYITGKIKSYICSKLRDEQGLSLGIEVENFVYDSNSRRIPANRGKSFSSEDLKKQLSVLNKQVGIAPTFTIEPGGQIEYSSTPYQNIHSLSKERKLCLKNLFKICKDEQLMLLDISAEPLYKPADIPIIDLKKYQIMHERFSKTGRLGHWMMKNSASLQINLDFMPEKEAARLAFLADCLQPFLSLTFANAPFIKGKPAGLKNLRIDFWNNTDPPRCGHLFDHGIQSPKNLLSGFAHLVMKTPAIFIITRNSNVKQFDGTLGEWLTQQYDNNLLTNDDIQIALHQIFTHVRFKNILEIRGPDRPPLEYEMAPAAMIAGLLRSPAITDRLLDIVSPWSPEERSTVQRKAGILDLTQTAYNGKTFQQWIELLFDMALEGLDYRSKTMNIPNERKYLDPFIEVFLRQGPFALYTQREFEISNLSLKEFLKLQWVKQKDIL